MTNTEQRAREVLDDQCAGGVPTYSATEVLYPKSVVIRAMLAFASPPTTGGDVTQARELMFLEILSAMGGKSDASDWPGSWVNAFCEEHEGRNPDTFNAVEQCGFTQVSHDSDTDHSVVYLTEKGKARLAALATAQAAEGEFIGEGWVYFNDGSGEEYSRNHPVDSGEVIDATNIRRSTEQEDHLWNALQTAHHVLSLPTSPTPDPVSREAAAKVAERYITHGRSDYDAGGDAVAASIATSLRALPAAQAGRVGEDIPAAFESWWAMSRYHNRRMIGYSDKKCLAFAAFEAALAALSPPSADGEEG